MSDDREIVLAVPPGTYFLGDPGYAVPDEDWQAMCNRMNEPESFPSGTPVTVMRGHRVIGFSIVADGIYRDQSGGAYQVDTAMIGLVPEALYEQRDEADASACRLDRVGRIVTFENTVTARFDAGSGLMAFGPYEISTGGGAMLDAMQSYDQLDSPN